MAQFIPGGRYALTFPCNSDLHVVYEVLKRTQKFVTVTDGRDTVRCKIDTFQGEEFCLPLGRYSMAPALRANINRRVGHLGCCNDLPVGVHTTGMGP